eukprot:4603323-Prymnesium_polylepis.1
MAWGRSAPPVPHGFPGRAGGLIWMTFQRSVPVRVCVGGDAWGRLSLGRCERVARGALTCFECRQRVRPGIERASCLTRTA